MADPMIVKLIPAYSTDRLGQRPIAIVAHGTAGTDSRVYLQTGGGRGVSIHVLIAKNGTIYRMVPDERGANHAGAVTSSFTLGGHTYSGSEINRATLGFELENLQDGRDPYTPLQLAAMGWQIVQWRKRWGNLPVLRHGDLDPTRRRDPYQLSTEQIEQCVAKAMRPPLVNPLEPPKPKAYRVKGIPVYEASSRSGKLWGHLREGETIVIDDPSNGHLADHRGFIRFDQDTLEPI